jgi:hypothetical protein
MIGEASSIGSIVGQFASPNIYEALWEKVQH